MMSGRWAVQESPTRTTPGSAIAATIRCSRLIARGTQYPAWLIPVIAIGRGSTSSLVEQMVDVGVMTCSQSGRK